MVSAGPSEQRSEGREGHSKCREQPVLNSGSEVGAAKASRLEHREGGRAQDEISQAGRTDLQGPAGWGKGSALFSVLSAQEGGPSSPRVTPVTA